jgi:LuxR family maltose regulon positive regulatory protein
MLPVAAAWRTSWRARCSRPSSTGRDGDAGWSPGPALGDRLGRGVESALTLVSAPAGFGKTTVLTAWLAARSAGGRAPTEAVLATLLNDLHGVPDDIVLVLDDYHVIDAPDVQDGVAFLLEHLPHRVWSSR